MEPTSTELLTVRGIGDLESRMDPAFSFSLSLSFSIFAQINKLIRLLGVLGARDRRSSRENRRPRCNESSEIAVFIRLTPTNLVVSLAFNPVIDPRKTLFNPSPRHAPPGNGEWRYKWLGDFFFFYGLFEVERN